MNKLDLVEQTQVNTEVQQVNPGDTVNIHYRVREEKKSVFSSMRALLSTFEALVPTRRLPSVKSPIT